MHIPGNNKYINQYTLRNKVELIRGGQEYFRLMVELITSATHSIHLQTYIFKDDETGELVSEALVKAATNKVKVFLMVDGYASRGLADSFISYLQNGGVSFKYFQPLFKNRYFYFGRRMHHKVLVVDGKHALVGGINITNRYNDLPGKPAWLDFALYVKGEAAIHLFKFCHDFWKSKNNILSQLPPGIEKYAQLIPEKEICSVRVRRNDWLKNKTEIWRSYLHLFSHATSSIVILSSYFLPGWELLRKLKKASKRDVKITVVLTGISDVSLAKFAERYLYYWMLKNNISIYEYQPAVLHAKLAIVDGHWVTIGSYNINNLSARASIEINLDVRNKIFAQQTQIQVQDIIERDCILITKEYYNLKTGLFKRIWQKISYHVINFILTVFTFYFKREFNKPNTDADHL